MGVHGLWQILEPCARPTNLASLNRQRLAVDASIWIYQFLKAVRDKEGHALRNAHVVGFFRRICKLLWCGILPVFVFDGGAPALKRATLQARRRRREGRRDDAVRTAGKLLAVQMHRMAQEEESAKTKRSHKDASVDGENGADGAIEDLPSVDQMVYADEQLLTPQQRQRGRQRFQKQDAYHLPDLDDDGMLGHGQPNDPRIMSLEELEDYARQSHAGEDINLYDFSKIDFDGAFFRSLPPVDRYTILNAARIRSRLRMGLSKDQLDTLFPDRMAFSRFQIERVRERNHLTQHLMIEAGMSGIDLTMGPNPVGTRGGGLISTRVAGERDREYILVKNDSAEGGWALGVVSRDKEHGHVQHKPIDVDALPQKGDGEMEDEGADEDDVEFEDVPIAGLNRLPKLSSLPPLSDAGQEADEDALFVDPLFVAEDDDSSAYATAMADSNLAADEEDDLRQAIALSLQNQHGIRKDDGRDHALDIEAASEDRTDGPPEPQWTQKAVEAPRPIFGSTGQIVAHVVNNRANTVVATAKAPGVTTNEHGSDGNDSSYSSDNELDIRAAMAKAARLTAKAKETVAPAFDGPLPFEKLDWRTSIFEKKPTSEPAPAPSPQASPVFSCSAAENAASTTAELAMARTHESAAFEADDSDADIDAMAGGFERTSSEPAAAADEGDGDGGNGSQVVRTEQNDGAPRPLPPWMADHTDIRTSMQQQRQYDNAANAEDRAMALAEAALWQRRTTQPSDLNIVAIDTSSDDESDVVAVDTEALQTLSTTSEQHSRPEPVAETSLEAASATAPQTAPALKIDGPTGPAVDTHFATLPGDDGLYTGVGHDGHDGEDDYDVSDPEEDALLVQMAEEAEEHARFTSTLNSGASAAATSSVATGPSLRESQAAYEAELKALQQQQKKDRRDADEVTQVMVAECQALLRLFGIPYLTAPMEAEAQCATLVALGLVDGIVTDDSDTFLFGGTRVYKNMFNGNKYVECYLAADLEREMSLSHDALVALAQLLGSDYTDGLPGVGPVTAMEILGEFPGPDGLEQFRSWWEDVQSPVQPRPLNADSASAFRRKFRKAQATKLFLPTGFPSPAVAEAYRHPEVDRSTEPFQWGVPDLDRLRRFLMATVGWSQERTDEVLVPVLRDMNRREAEGTQSNITRFFNGRVGAGVAVVPAQAQADKDREQHAAEAAGIQREAYAPPHAPRSKNTAGSRRMAAAVSKLKASVAGVVEGPTQTDAQKGQNKRKPSTVTGQKRKGRGRVAAAASDEDEYKDDADSTAATMEGTKRPRRVRKRQAG